MVAALTAGGSTPRRMVLGFTAVLLLALLAVPAQRAEAQTGYGDNRTPVDARCAATGQTNDYHFKDNFITYVMDRNTNPPFRVETVAWMTANVEWCSDGRTITWGPKLRGDRDVTSAGGGTGQDYGVVPVGFEPQSHITGTGLRTVVLEARFQRDYAAVLEAQGSVGIGGGIDLDRRQRGPVRSTRVEIAISPQIDQSGHSYVRCAAAGVERTSGQIGATRCYRNALGVAAGPPNLGVYSG